MERRTRDRQVLGRGQEHPDGRAGYGRPDDFRLVEPWVRDCAPWNQFSFKWQRCRVEWDRMRSDCTFFSHSDTKVMSRIKLTWCGGEMTRKRDSRRGMRWSLQRSEWKSNSKHVEHMSRLWRLKLGSKETSTLVTKATGRRRDIDETLMKHDVRASKEAAGTRSPAMESSIQEET